MGGCLVDRFRSPLVASVPLISITITTLTKLHHRITTHDMRQVCIFLGVRALAEVRAYTGRSPVLWFGDGVAGDLVMMVQFFCELCRGPDDDSCSCRSFEFVVDQELQVVSMAGTQTITLNAPQELRSLLRADPKLRWGCDALSGAPRSVLTGPFRQGITMPDDVIIPRHHEHKVVYTAHGPLVCLAVSRRIAAHVDVRSCKAVAPEKARFNISGGTAFEANTAGKLAPVADGLSPSAEYLAYVENIAGAIADSNFPSSPSTLSEVSIILASHPVAADSVATALKKAGGRGGKGVDGVGWAVLKVVGGRRGVHDMGWVVGGRVVGNWRGEVVDGVGWTVL